MSLPADRLLGKYQVIGELGSGGMATVYRAIHPGLRAEVAIKVIRAYLSGHPSFQTRFRLEAETLFRLNHPHILRLLDFDEADGTPFIVYPFVPGGTLRDRLDGAPWTLDRTVALLRPLADALDYAHGRGVVHRDVKPNNVLLDEDDQPVLADFGLVRLLAFGTGAVAAQEPTEAQLTSVGMAMGTPPYMAPEQALGLPVDGRADQYALGIVAYELLTGRPPYRQEHPGETPQMVANKHVYDPLPAPTRFNPALSAATEAALLRVLAKRPEDRYPSCLAFIDALAQSAQPEAAVASSDVPPSPEPSDWTPRPARRAPEPGPAGDRAPADPLPQDVGAIWAGSQPSPATGPAAAGDASPRSEESASRTEPFGRVLAAVTGAGFALYGIAAFFTWMTPEYGGDANSLASFVDYQLGSWFGHQPRLDGVVVLAIAVFGVALAIRLGRASRERPRAAPLWTALALAVSAVALGAAELNYVNNVDWGRDPLSGDGVYAAAGSGPWLLVAGAGVAASTALLLLFLDSRQGSGAKQGRRPS